MSEPTKDAMSRDLLGKVVDEVFGGELVNCSTIDQIYAVIAPYIRAQATNDTLHAVRKCEQRSGTCFMVHSILNKRHPDVCDAENCNSIREMKVPT